MPTYKRQKSKMLKELRKRGMSFPLAALVARHSVQQKPASYLMAALEKRNVHHTLRGYHDHCNTPELVVYERGNGFVLNYFGLTLVD